MGVGATTGALFFAGGCGIDVPPSTPTVEAVGGQEGGAEREGPSASVGVDSNAGGGGEGEVGGAGEAPDTHLLLKNCRATDVVDVLSPMQRRAVEKEAGKGGGRGEGGQEGEAQDVAFMLVASDSMRWVVVVDVVVVVVEARLGLSTVVVVVVVFVVVVVVDVFFTRMGTDEIVDSGFRSLGV